MLTESPIPHEGWRLFQSAGRAPTSAISSSQETRKLDHAPVSKVEGKARVALEELLGRFGRFGRFELEQPRVEYIDSYLVRGPQRLPLRVEA